MYKKIYLILLDGYPLNDRLINFSKKNNFDLVPQITSSIFTMPFISEMTCGKNINKNRINGMFYSMNSSQYNNKYVCIYELLSNKKWNIYVKQPDFNDFWTKYLINLNKLYINKKKLIPCKMSKNDIKNIQSKKQNSFCYIRETRFHDIYNFDNNTKSQTLEKALNDDFDTLKKFDFTEENAIFYIFADHGYSANRELIIPSDFVTWSLIKDNTKQYLKPRLEYPTRTAKSIYNLILDVLNINDLDYDYEKLDKFDNNKIYFIEDSRLDVTPMHSDSSAALIILEWDKDNYPNKFLQLTYFRGQYDKEKRYILCEHLKENWLDVKTDYTTNILFKGYEDELKQLFSTHKYNNLIRKLYISLWENITSMFKLEHKELGLNLKEINNIRKKSKYTIPQITPIKKAFIPSLNKNLIEYRIDNIQKENYGKEYKGTINKCLNKLLILDINEIYESFNYYIHPNPFIKNNNSGLMKCIHVYKKIIYNRLKYNITDNNCNEIILNDNSWEYIVTCFVGEFKYNLRKTNKTHKIDIIPKYTYEQIKGEELYVFENINDFSCKIFKSKSLTDNFSNNLWKHKFSFISPNK